MFHKRRPQVGARPGAFALPGGGAPPTIRVMRFGPDEHDEPSVASVPELRERIGAFPVTWADIHGFGDGALLRDIAGAFDLHPLLIADVVNVPQRPKVEAYGDRHLLVVRMATIGGDGAVDVEQVSVVLGPGWVLTFQERPGDVFDPVRQRIRRGGGPIRRLGPAYLAYALLDAVVDGYYPVLEALGDRLERLEEEITTDPSQRFVHAVYGLRRDLLELRRAIWPLRDAVSALVRDDDIDERVTVYYRDVHDHCVQVLDVIESYREMAASLLDVYLSTVSNRMNEIMKVLTIMASLFIPLTFIAGIYGMNFEYMPELRARWAYPAALGGMLAIAAGLLWYFRHRGWLGASGATAGSERPSASAPSSAGDAEDR